MHVSLRIRNHFKQLLYFFDASIQLQRQRKHSGHIVSTHLERFGFFTSLLTDYKTKTNPNIIDSKHSCGANVYVYVWVKM